jgi:hypothetical protein
MNAESMMKADPEYIPVSQNNPMEWTLKAQNSDESLALEAIAKSLPPECSATTRTSHQGLVHLKYNQIVP